MKKLLLLLVLTAFTSHIAKSQVVFGAPGAEWRYVFRIYLNNTDHRANMYYLRDSTIGSETLKVIGYRSFFKLSAGNPCSIVLIKQKGDTIFMKNCTTAGTWQILYNFAATTGQQWITTLKDSLYPSGNSGPLSYTTTVLSVSTVTLNGMSLKKLHVTYDYPSPYGAGASNGHETADIIERIGCTTYLFNFRGRPSSTDPGELTDFLCYKDNAIGTVEGFSTKGCDAAIGIRENKISANGIKLYPQPAGNALTIETSTTGQNYEVRITDLTGRLMIQTKLQGQTSQIDISILAEGIYNVQLFNDGKLSASGKLVKE